MAARKSAKKTAARKTAPKTKTGGKRKAAKEETSTGRKSAKGNAAGKDAPASKPATTEGAEEKDAIKISSMSVNLGHVFSLRPRVSKSFRQADFLTAKHLLRDEDYASIEEAARAVAEKALELTHEGPPKRGFRPGR